MLGGGISAIGGVADITGIAGCVWNHEGLSGVGWLAVALVIFCLWKPSAAIWGSILFGCLQNLYLRLSIPFIPSQIYKILPYIVTVVVLIFSSLRNNRESSRPPRWASPTSARSAESPKTNLRRIPKPGCGAFFRSSGSSAARYTL